MKCKYHDREAITRCRVCGAALCSECDAFQKTNEMCPECSKKYLNKTYKSYKTGIMYNVLSMVCAVGFLVLYLLSFAKLLMAYKIAGGVVLAVMLPLTVFMFVKSVSGARKLKKQLNKNNVNNIQKAKQEKVNNEPMSVKRIIINKK